MTGFVILLTLVGLGIYFYMLVRIGRSSVLLAIGCFLFAPLLLLALGIYWKNEESDIKVPFFILFVMVVIGNVLLAREERRRALESLLMGAQLFA